MICLLATSLKSRIYHVVVIIAMLEKQCVFFKWKHFNAVLKPAFYETVLNVRYVLPEYPDK